MSLALIPCDADRGLTIVSQPSSSALASLPSKSGAMVTFNVQIAWLRELTAFMCLLAVALLPQSCKLYC